MTEVRVSFQGGGALLALMLPVAHALREAQARGDIAITRIAGTSAGSVAGALLAGGADFDALRAFCMDRGRVEGLVRAMARPALYSPAAREAGGWLTAVPRFLAGREVADPRAFRRLLAELFVASGVAATPDALARLTLADFSVHPRVPLHVMRSDLALMEGVEAPGTEALLDALADSCAVPFVLRSWRAARHRSFVDGGLCDNLPVAALGPDDNVPIFGVSVDDPAGDIAGMKGVGFLLRLFSTAINHNVRRSLRVIGPDMMIRETSPFSFADARGAVEWLLHPGHYNAAFERATRTIAKLARIHSKLSPTAPFLSGRHSVRGRDRQLHKLLAWLERPAAFEVQDAQGLVEAESTRHMGAGQAGLDIVTTKTRVRVIDPAARFYRSHVTQRGDFIRPTTYRVYNLTRKRNLAIDVFHYRDDGPGKDSDDPCFLHFLDPDPFSADDEIEVRLSYVPDGDMWDLVKKGSDFLAFLNPHPIPVRMEIRFVHAAHLGDLVAEPYAMDDRPPIASTLAYDERAEAETGELADRTAIITAAEDVPPGAWFGVTLRRGAT